MLIRFFYSFLALCAAGCLGQDGGLEGEGRSLTLLVRLDGRVHHAVDQFAIGDAAARTDRRPANRGWY